MKTKEKLGCIILMIPFILLVIWIRWSNYNDEIQREKINNIQQQIDSIPDGKGRIDMLNMLYEMDGLYRNERYLKIGITPKVYYTKDGATSNISLSGANSY